MKFTWKIDFVVAESMKSKTQKDWPQNEAEKLSTFIFHSQLFHFAACKGHSGTINFITCNSMSVCTNVGEINGSKTAKSILSVKLNWIFTCTTFKRHKFVWHTERTEKITRVICMLKNFIFCCFFPHYFFTL